MNLTQKESLHENLKVYVANAGFKKYYKDPTSQFNFALYNYKFFEPEEKKYFKNIYSPNDEKTTDYIFNLYCFKYEMELMEQTKNIKNNAYENKNFQSELIISLAIHSLNPYFKDEKKVPREQLLFHQVAKINAYLNTIELVKLKSDELSLSVIKQFQRFAAKEIVSYYPKEISPIIMAHCLHEEVVNYLNGSLNLETIKLLSINAQMIIADLYSELGLLYSKTKDISELFNDYRKENEIDYISFKNGSRMDSDTYYHLEKVAQRK